MKKYRMGIDLGTNSLGWCLLELDEENNPKGIMDGGSRIFSDGRDPKSGTSLAVDRRIARGARRRRGRYLRRRKVLMNKLIELNLMPGDKSERKALENRIDPYEARAKALDEILTPHELGRALFHLNQRRGFKSNRKTTSREEKSKIGDDLAGLQEAMEKSFSRTLGEYLWQRHQERQLIRARTGEKLYPKRMHYESEFDAIRKVQSSNFPQIKNEDWDRLREIIFYQRELRPPEPGYCRFIEEEHRAPRALPCFQKFSIAQDLVNLQIIFPDRTKRSLDESERNLLWVVFTNQKTVSFNKIRTLLRLPNEIEFNLETDRRKELKGDHTANFLSNKKYFGSKWNGFGGEAQNDIVHFLLEAQEDEKVLEQALNGWGMSEEQANNLIDLDLDKLSKGYARFSRTALEKLWPPMLEEGLLYDDAARVFGWNHSDSYPAKGELLPELPYYGQLLQESVVGTDPSLPDDHPDQKKRWGGIGNPTVHIGLNQLRVVVNAIIARYGPPEEIVVELARELKLNHKQKEELKKEQFRNQKRNKDIAKVLEGLGVEDNPKNRDKYKLWEELNPKDSNDRKCPFSGEQISVNMIYSPQVHVEHILPRSRTLQDSMANKTLAMAHVNQFKGKRSPYEAFGHGGSPYDYEDILLRAKDMPGNKRWRFQRDAMERFEDEDGFLDRQLNDTRYLSRVAKKYLSNICSHNKVWAIPGQLTALIRRKLDLRKSRNDHRHHAIDALVTALTDRKLLQKVSRLSGEDEADRIVVKEPWEGFFRDVAKWRDGIIVSHRPNHSIKGRLHEDTNYGFLENPSQWEKEQGYNLVCSKAVEALTNKELEAVRDRNISAKLLEATYEISDKKAFQQALANFSAETGIRRVRVLKKDKTVQPIHHPVENPEHKRGIVPGEIHHIAFWRLPDGKIETTGLSLFEANQMGRKDHRPHPGAKLVLKLHKRDIVRLEHKSVLKTVRVVSISPENKNMRFATLQDSGEDQGGYFKISFSKFKQCKVRKIHVDPLGKVKDPGDVLW